MSNNLAQSNATTEQRLPPITELAVATMVLVVVTGIYLTALMPQPVSLPLPIILLSAASLILIVNLILVSRLRDFAWGTFFLVGRWALLAYLVIAGMLEYVFILDRTPSTTLALLTVALVIYAVDIPLLFAFSVARYARGGTSERVQN